MARSSVHAIAEVYMRTVAVALGLICLVAAACGGDKKSSRSAEAPAAPTATAASTELVSASAVLSNAAQKSQQVDSLRGELSMDMDFGQVHVGLDGNLLFKAPDTGYVTMHILGRDIEVLVYGTDMYMRAEGDWMKLDLSAVGIDTSQFEDIVKNRGFFDLDSLTDSLGDVEQLKDETIDGKVYHRYQADADFDELLGKLPDGFIDPTIASAASDAISKVGFDFWIDPETELPRRFAMTMSMDIEGDSGTMEMTFDYLEYNGQVDIPAKPTDAKPFDPSELGG
jgi:hypothetical protein